MAKDILVEVLDANLLEHPAAIAWRKVAPDHGAPDRITKLKETRRSRVYRLHGAGPRGAPVIAKLCTSAGVAIERAIYEDVLPNLPVTALRFYGLLEDSEGHWLFLEDSGSQKYSSWVRCIPPRHAGLLRPVFRSGSQATTSSGCDPLVKRSVKVLRILFCIPMTGWRLRLISNCMA